MSITIRAQIILDQGVKVHNYPGHCENEAYSDYSELSGSKIPPLEGAVIVDESQVVIIRVAVVELTDGLAGFHIEVAQKVVFLVGLRVLSDFKTKNPKPFISIC